MWKLRNYLKPFFSSIIIIIALLFVQAMCELKMPDYMSDIVNIGIHANGIEDGVFNAIRENEVNKLKIFMDKDDMDEFYRSYQKFDKSTANESIKAKYPIVKEEPIYVLKEQADSKKVKMSISNAETVVMAIHQGSINRDSSINNLSDEQKKLVEMMQSLPQNVDVFTMFAQMPKEQVNEITNEILEVSDAMGESTLNSIQAKYVYEEYTALGMDTAKIQYMYLFNKGGKMLLVALFAGLAAIGVGFLASRAGAGFARNLRKDVFRKVEGFSEEQFNKFSTNTLITRTTNDIQQTQMVFIMVLRVVIFAPIIGIGAVLKIMQTNADMTWIIALVIVIILGIMIFAFAVVMPKFKILQKLMDNLNGIVREILDGMLVIRAFNNQKQEKEKFKQANKKIMKTNVFTARAMSTLMPFVMLIMNCATVLIVWVGSHQVDDGLIQIGDMMAFMQYAMQIIMAFMMITMISIMIPRASVAASRVYEILQTKSSITDPEKPISLPKENLDGNAIEFKDVCFRYPNAEEDILKNISFTAQTGKTTAFIGSTGSGKSTLMSLILRFYDVSSGQILFNGVDIKDITQYELRNHIGYVPQKGMLFSGTIASNLRYANENATKDDLLEATQVAQALEFIEEKEEGFDYPITQQGTNVSGGQRQRLSIARALVKKANLYIFDDTFSALDFKTDAKLRKALYKLCQEKNSTVLIVAQRISTIMQADKIIVLDEGEIVGSGTHQQLLKECKVYREIAYSQLSKEEL